MEREFMNQLTATERENINSNDDTAVLRNRGDGFDDEECPEKETFEWELRSQKSLCKIPTRIVIYLSADRCRMVQGLPADTGQVAQ